MSRATWGVACAVIALGIVLGLVWRGRAHTDVTHVATVGTPQVPYAPSATIKELMDTIVDPSADVVWNAVSTTVTKSGPDERVPRSDADWTSVRQGAIRLVEASNLLVMPGRHVAHPGEKSETPGVELEPEQMEALINQDRAVWNQRAEAFRTVGLEVLKATDARDANALFEAGDRLDTACENCHKQYWYPNEKIPDFPSDGSTPTQGSPQ